MQQFVAKSFLSLSKFHYLCTQTTEIMIRKTIVAAAMLAACSTATGQVEVRTEAQVTAASGDHNPLWLNANKYGLSSLDKTNGYVRAGAFRSKDNDSAKTWRWGAGLDVAVAGGFTSTAVVQQAYGEVQWKKGLLTLGSKEQPMELKNQELSSGPQTLGINARPLPGVRLSLPDYWTVPYTKGWLGLKGHISYGMMTDDRWQEDFTQGLSKHTKHTKVHTKAGYLRIGKDAKPVSVELGLEMACQFGGSSYADYTTHGLEWVDNEDGIKGMLRALIPSGGDAGEGIYENTSGNNLGSYLLRVNFNYDKWYLGVYADHFFEDHSQMFFIDFDGYGQGEEFNEWEDNRWFVYDLKDMLIGAELKLKKQHWLNSVVLEYVYTKYQSGPVYHDRTTSEPTHIGGRDGYYNHYIFTGWQHWGQAMGNPLYMSPLYNDDGSIEVKDNRFWAWHLGVSGNLLNGLHYRVLATYQKGYGSYYLPFPDPRHNVSIMGEATYRFPSSSRLHGWHIKGALGLDKGKLLGDNIGVQVTIGKRFELRTER